MRTTTANDNVFDFQALLHPGTVFEHPKDVVSYPDLTLAEKRAILELRPEHTAMIAKKLGVQEKAVVEMNRRLGGDGSLNTLVHADEAGEVQDLLADPASSPDAVYAEQQEAKLRRQALAGALEVLNPRERCIFRARFLSEPSVRLEDLAILYAFHASGYGRAKIVPWKRFELPFKPTLGTKHQDAGAGSARGKGDKCFGRGGGYDSAARVTRHGVPKDTFLLEIFRKSGTPT